MNMSVLRIVNIIVWALFAIGSLLLTISDFGWFVLLMTIGCTGMTALSCLEYSWSRDLNKWEG
jgi:hypothetical protein